MRTEGPTAAESSAAIAAIVTATKSAAPKLVAPETAAGAASDPHNSVVASAKHATTFALSTPLATEFAVAESVAIAAAEPAVWYRRQGERGRENWYGHQWWKFPLRALWEGWRSLSQGYGSGLSKDQRDNGRSWWSIRLKSGWSGYLVGWSCLTKRLGRLSRQMGTKFECKARDTATCCSLDNSRHHATGGTRAQGGVACKHDGSLYCLQSREWTMCIHQRAQPNQLEWICEGRSFNIGVLCWGEEVKGGPWAPSPLARASFDAADGMRGRAGRRNASAIELKPARCSPVTFMVVPPIDGWRWRRQWEATCERRGDGGDGKESSGER